VWDVIAAGDVPSAAGWTDDGTVVRLTTSTDQVGIGTASPGASLGLVNANATTDVILKITGKASQTGDSLRIADSGNVSRLQVSAPTTETLVDLTPPSGGRTRIRFIPVSAQQQFIDWGNTGDFGPALGTNTGLGCPGSRFTTFWDASDPQFCDAYGQDAADAWVLIDKATSYSFWTPDTTSASRQRASWSPNGDLSNFGRIRTRKFTVGTTGLAAGVPGIELEETGSGTQIIAIRAPAAVAANRIVLTQDLNGIIPIVGNDPPSVASGSLGQVDLTGQTAAIGSTNLSNTPPAGIYVVHVVVECTTASGSGAPTLDMNLAWTDTLGATNRNATANPGETAFPLSLAATGRTSATFIIQVASGNISYSTTINAASGSPQYAIYIRVMALG